MSLSISAALTLSGEGEGGAVCSLPSPSSKEALPLEPGCPCPTSGGSPCPQHLPGSLNKDFFGGTGFLPGDRPKGIQEDVNCPASPHLPTMHHLSFHKVPLSQFLGSPKQGVQCYWEPGAGSSQRCSAKR